MTDSRAAHRYALALIEVAEEQKALERVHQDLEFLDNLIGTSRELHLFLVSPVVNSEKKKRVLKELLAGRVTELTMHFVMMLAAKGREGLMREIIAQFSRLRDERLGILSVTARTVVKFSDAQVRHLVSQLERATRKKIRISFLTDPSLKGGFTVQHDDTVWDASVRRQLELLRDRFARGDT